MPSSNVFFFHFGTKLGGMSKTCGWRIASPPWTSRGYKLPPLALNQSPRLSRSWWPRWRDTSCPTAARSSSPCSAWSPWGTTAGWRSLEARPCLGERTWKSTLGAPLFAKGDLRTRRITRSGRHRQASSSLREPSILIDNMNQFWWCTRYLVQE